MALNIKKFLFLHTGHNKNKQIFTREENSLTKAKGRRLGNVH